MHRCKGQAFHDRLYMNRKALKIEIAREIYEFSKQYLSLSHKGNRCNPLIIRTAIIEIIRTIMIKRLVPQWQ